MIQAIEFFLLRAPSLCDLQPVSCGFFGDLAVIVRGIPEQTLFDGVFLDILLDDLGCCFQFGGQFVQRCLFGGEAAPHDQFGRYVTDLVPPELIVRRCFATEQAALDELTAELETATQVVEEYVEEHAVEEGLLWDATNDDGKVTKKTATDRLKVAKREGADQEELDSLNHVLGLFKAESAAKKEFKDATIDLQKRTLAHYGNLTDTDVQQLVIDDKWGATITCGVEAELQALIQHLV